MLEELSEILPLWAVCAFPHGVALLPTRKTLPENPRSVLVAAFSYFLPDEHYAGRNIARYAVVRDYHQVVAARLEQACALLREHYPNDEFVHYCDHSPLPEAALAEHAGLGVRGRHNLLITEKYGSWVVLGEIATSATLPPMRNTQCAILSCGDCGLCIKACPAGALGHAQFDRTQCLSYISQRKEQPSEQAAAQLRAMHSAWGCDICQQVCPHNRKATIDPLPEFLQGAVAQLTHHTPIENRAYAWRGQKLLGRNIENLADG
ncbi:MAG: DUF1730 domain-containing protein [Oscillospiraceae bacterium]|nr:DUF1730 domain-containing protein [Oscillospiraceae bacterium]